MGLETAFAVMYTHLVKPGVLTLEKLIELMAINPRKRFGIPDKNSFSVWKLEEAFTVNPEEFLSKGRATPFAGETLYGVNYLTVIDGKIIYQK